MGLIHIGFHTGPAGNARGLGDYFKALDTAGIPAIQKAADDYGPCDQLVKLSRASGIDHTIVFRLSTRGQKDGHDYDVPNYDNEPTSEADNHWQMTLAKLPPEFDKSRVWLEVINEVDKNRADWLGRFGCRIAELALQQGYKVALFGFSSGEPEPEHWREPGMVDFLHIAAANPDRVAVALHEYTLDRDKTLQEADRWWIGRYVELLIVTDDLGLDNPTILITEFGWAQDWAPAPMSGMPQLHWANDTYYGPDRIPTALWWLGGGFRGIADRVQPYIDPVKVWALTGDIDPPPPNETDKQRRWRLTIEEQEAHGLQLSDTAIQNAIRADGFQMVTKEMYVEGEPPMAGAEDWAKRIRPRRVYQWIEGRVEWFEDPDDDKPPPPPPVGDVDLLPYMAGVTSGNGPLYELQTSWGPQERVQTQWHGDRFLTTKGNEVKANWEERWTDDEWIYFGTDTSESETRYYTQRDGDKYGAVWCPRRMTVGQSAYREPHLTHYSKLDCQPVNSGVVPSYLHFIEGPKAYTFDSGIMLDDVIELGFSFAPDGLSFVERYLFAKGFGLVGWFSQDGRYSWISEIHQPGQRPDNKPLVIPCLDTG
jgi:hypothetical protein